MNMAWNGAKFVLLRLGAKEELKDNTMVFTPNHESPIEPVEVARDLGIKMDAGLTFKAQRASAAAKARSMAGWALRTFRSREPSLMRTLWRTLVQPHQDYASQLWAPVGRRGDIGVQEAPLRAFTKRVRGLRDLPYQERLQALHLLSTERRVERYRIIYTFKIITGLVPNCGMTLSGRVDTRRGLLVEIPPLTGSRQAVVTLREQSLLCEGPRLYNTLPSSLRRTDWSLPTFKSHLDSWFQTLPDIPVTPGTPCAATDQNGTYSNSVRAWASAVRRDPSLSLDPEWIAPPPVYETVLV